MPGNVTRQIPGSSQEVGETTECTTTSVVDVLVPGMTITPQEGTYDIWFTGTGTNSLKGCAAVFSIYAAGVRIDESESVVEPGGNDFKGSFRCTARVEVNGTQAIEGKFKAGSNTAKVYARTLLIRKVV